MCGAQLITRLNFSALAYSKLFNRYLEKTSGSADHLWYFGACPPCSNFTINVGILTILLDLVWTTTSEFHLELFLLFLIYFDCFDSTFEFFEIITSPLENHSPTVP